MPAITVANAVPAMAACSVGTAPHFSVVAGDPYDRSESGAGTGATLASFSQDFTVTALGGAGTAELVLTLHSFVAATAGAIDRFSSDWSNTTNPNTFTRAFAGCSEVSVATAHYTYFESFGTNEAYFTATVTP